MERQPARIRMSEMRHSNAHGTLSGAACTGLYAGDILVLMIMTEISEHYQVFFFISVFKQHQIDSVLPHPPIRLVLK